MVYETQKQIDINTTKGKSRKELPFFTHENALSKFHSISYKIVFTASSIPFS